MKSVLAVVILPGLLFADFRYDQTTRITKGMVTKMAFGKKPEPTTTSHYFKGGRMATASKDSKTIIDFDKQLLTTINLDKKQYWQTTFEEMRQMMADLQSDMKDAGKGNDVSIDMKFDAKATGVEKEVAGLRAKEVIFTIEMGMSDGKSSGSAMKMVSDSWHSETVPGYEEYKAFHARLADKGSWMNAGQLRSQMGGQKGMAEGMKKMAEEMQKTPGIAVLTIMRMTMPGMSMDMSNSGGSGNGGTGSNSQNGPASLGDAARQAGGQIGGETAGRQVAGPLGGMIGGALGGKFGGFGKKKKEEAPKVNEADVAAKAKEAEAQARQTAADSAAASKSGDGMLMMESLTDANGFSSESISEDVFAIPAGFTKVEPDLAKRRKK